MTAGASRPRRLRADRYCRETAGAGPHRRFVSAPDADPRPYGRRAFLALLAGGVSSFAWALPASRVLSPITSGFSQFVADILPVGGWRIYTISGSMPVFDAKAWRLEITGL